MIRFLILLLSVFHLTVGLLGQTFDFTEVVHHLEYLSSDFLEGRGMGTQGGKRATDYIATVFEDSQLQQFDSTWYQDFSVISGLRPKKRRGRNVWGCVQGALEPSKWIIITAHHDHLGKRKGVIYNGADDDASGVCALFAFADYFRTSSPHYSVMLIAFDGEEVGLLGSKNFIDHLPFSIDNIVANLNLDMIGRNDQNQIYLCGNRYDSTLFSRFEMSDKKSGLQVLLGHDGLDNKEDWTYSSDHGNFHKVGIPFVYIGVEDHIDYHKPTDDFENIQIDFYEKALKLCLYIFNCLDKP